MPMPLFIIVNIDIKALYNSYLKSNNKLSLI